MTYSQEHASHLRHILRVMKMITDDKEPIEFLELEIKRYEALACPE